MGTTNGPPSAVNVIFCPTSGSVARTGNFISVPATTQILSIV